MEILTTIPVRLIKRRQLMRQLYLAMFICAYMLIDSDVWAMDWRGITPLHSTRTDVERILGVKTSGKSYDQFIIDGDRVSVLFSTTRCEGENPRGYNVPLGTVLEIIVFPKKVIPISSLDLDMNTFKLVYTDSEGELSYENNEDGLYITAISGQVRAFTYGRASKDRQLLCQSKN